MGSSGAPVAVMVPRTDTGGPRCAAGAATWARRIEEVIGFPETAPGVEMTLEERLAGKGRRGCGAAATWGGGWGVDMGMATGRCCPVTWVAGWARLPAPTGSTAPELAGRWY